MTELAIVVPTLNEAANVAELVSRIDRALGNVAWEIVFVDDDSPDGTADAVRGLARRDSRVRVLQRLNRRGLSRAVIEGILSTSAPVIAVMDADLQHDERILGEMLLRLRERGLDMVVASRYAEGGGVGRWEAQRARMSGWGKRISDLCIDTRLTDPLSGFFMLTRGAFDRAVRRLSGEGFKLLLDLVASSPQPLRIEEVPYTFRPRAEGRSKLDAVVLWEFAVLLLHKRFRWILPARFLLYSLVGASGVLVHMLALWLAFERAGMAFAWAQFTATVVAMTSNFALNNLFTYRDMRLRGWQWWRGLASFYAVCGLGVVANVGVANVLFAHETTWLLAGIAGAFIGAVWNYVGSSVVTWRRR